MKKLLNYISLIAGICFLFVSTARATPLTDARDSYMNAISKFCVGKPKVNILPVEQLANRLGIHPRSITLERVYLKPQTARPHPSSDTYPLGNHSLCYGVIYTPIGSDECVLDFSTNGQVTELCMLGDDFSYTRQLREKYFKIYTESYPAPKENKGAQYDPETGTWGPGKF